MTKEEGRGGGRREEKGKDGGRAKGLGGGEKWGADSQ